MVNHFHATYTNHVGGVVEFGDGIHFINENDLHDYEWQTFTINDKISNHYKSIKTFSVDVLIACSSVNEGLTIRDALTDTFEVDVINNKKGTLSVNGWSINCFCKASSKKDIYLKDQKFMELTLSIETDDDFWRKDDVLIDNVDASDILSYPISKYNNAETFIFRRTTRIKCKNNAGVLFEGCRYSPDFVFYDAEGNTYHFELVRPVGVAMVHTNDELTIDLSIDLFKKTITAVLTNENQPDANQYGGNWLTFRIKDVEGEIFEFSNPPVGSWRLKATDKVILANSGRTTETQYYKVLSDKFTVVKVNQRSEPTWS